LKSQSLKQLEAQRLSIIKDIERTSKLLEAHKSNKASDINKLNTLETQLSNSENLIKTLKKEVQILAKNNSDKVVTNSFSESDYDNLLVATYKKKIAEPNNIKDQKIREIYLRQFAKKTSSQAQKNSAENPYQSKKEALAKEEDNLVQLKNEIKKLSQNLKVAIIDEGDLEQEYNQKVADRKRLNDKIQNLLFNNFGSSNVVSSTSSNTFENKKGFLSWPIDNGTIELRFGEQKLKENKSLVFVNTGIDISSSNRNAKAIFEGEVVTVTNISPKNITIIIKHPDDYYSVYSNVLKSLVNKGDYVNTGMLLGELNKNSKGHYQIHFEMWRSKNNLNPYHWLKNN